jgi:hypothetical protein
MNIARNKTATTITMFLVLTIAFTLVVLPPASAQHSGQNVPTWTYVSVTPLTIGVNQIAMIVFWQNFIPPTANGAFGDRWTFYVDIVRPDGINETLGPFVSDPVGGSYTFYTPTQVGTYNITARFIGKTLDNTPNGPNPSGLYSGSSMGNMTGWLGSYWLPSVSEPVTLTVQQEQMPRYQETPLPSGYWTRPVYDANRLWGTIMGQWLNAGDAPGRVNAYTTGPETSHIMWSRPYWAGGVMGGGGNVNFGSYGYYSGLSYENYGGPSIILDGKVYYSVQTPPRYGWYCVDLYTGETIYYENDTSAPSYGQVLDMEYVNQHGGFPYLWRTSRVDLPTGAVSTGTWEMLDGFTGKSISKIMNVTQTERRRDLNAVGGYTSVTTGATGTAAVDNIGSIVRYNIVNLGNSTNPQRYLQVWNTTQAMWYNPVYYNTSATNLYWEWRPATTSNLAMPYPLVFNGKYGFSLNVSIPDVQGSIRQVVVDQYIIGGTTGNITGNPTSDDQGNFWCLSLKPGEEGRLLWNFTFTPPPGLGDVAIQSIQFSNRDTAFSFLDAADGVFGFEQCMNRMRWVYSLDPEKTGKPAGTLLWTSEPENQWNFYGMSDSEYAGRLYSYGYSGILIAYNITTGHIDWTWSAPYVGLDETYYEHTPLSLGCIAEGKLYFYSSEHSPSQPLRRDAKIYCVDAETGTMLWSETCWSNSFIIGDGRIVVLDLFDSSIYCYGKGNSATTVEASPEISVHGNSVMIKGTVTDDTPSGRLNTNGDLDFTLKGTPAIADDYMDAWMEYMFHQRPIPTDATGVEVSLDTVDPNGNYVHIGTVTSDINGIYGYAFNPDVPGTYQIIATFAGSAAYGPSSATTYLSVSEAPPATAPPEYPQPIDNTMTIVYATIAIIIAIALVGVWLKRK